MKAEELKGKTSDELHKTLLDLKKKQFNLRVQLSQGQLENTVQIRTVRRTIARVKTFIGQQMGGDIANAPVKAPKKAVSRAKPAAAKKTKTVDAKKSEDKTA
ncbi:MAG: 50S ribosomal protein L29 [Alphaproteobacteria bacterium CG_4_9_14_3_um_filter_47_13]|nr:MAG: 50S ribosomal protein L29 [Alphaproteobacteria bacterium CG_4_9_14_3_um_filter_47_13]